MMRGWKMEVMEEVIYGRTREVDKKRKKQKASRVAVPNNELFNVSEKQKLRRLMKRN